MNDFTLVLIIFISIWILVSLMYILTYIDLKKEQKLNSELNEMAQKFNHENILLIHELKEKAVRIQILNKVIENSNIKEMNKELKKLKLDLISKRSLNTYKTKFDVMNKLRKKHDY